jgi:prepilin-type N-terminal cleavage/methylation domain-containing protein
MPWAPNAQRESTVVQRLHQARERVAARVRRGEKGFTLIELLIVIVILGVLAAIVVFAVGAFNDRGHSAACKSDRKTVEVAVEAYRAHHNVYPNSETGTPSGWTQLVDGGYIRQAPAGSGYEIHLGADGVVTDTCP